MKFLSSLHSCKEELTHREFKKQCGASCVYYNDELAVLVVLVRIHSSKQSLIYLKH